MPHLRTFWAVTCAVVLGAFAGPLRAQDTQQEDKQQQNKQQSKAAGEQPPDEVLENRVMIRLARSPSLDGSSIAVDAKDGTVLLTGHVMSQAQQDRAERLARNIDGVKNVKTMLRVDPNLRKDRPAGNKNQTDAGGHQADMEKTGAESEAKLSDDELAKRVAHAVAQKFPGAKADKEWLFGWDVEGDEWQFDVEVDDRDVILDGSVRSWLDIGKVVNAARQVRGVRSVDASDLHVDPEFLANDPYYDWVIWEYHWLIPDTNRTNAGTTKQDAGTTNQKSGTENTPDRNEHRMPDSTSVTQPDTSS